MKRVCFLLAAVLLPAALFGQTAPPRPSSGPGGNAYPHAALAAKGPFYAAGFDGNDNYLYYIYEPALPAPAEAPVVLFLHGWLAYDPMVYGAWIQHMVKKGHVVVWVQYDAGLTFPVRFPDKAITTWRDALERLATQPDHVRPAMDGGRILTGIVGHSVGGYMSAIVAARAANPSNGIPVPAAVVAVEPGGLNVMRLEDLTQIAPETKLVLVVGDEDIAVGQEAALAVWEGTPQIPDENRDYLLVQSDRHGSPGLIADHNFPSTAGRRARVDGLDFYGTYKLSVGALRCAFLGADCEYAVGNGAPEQVNMGQWSDGVDVNPIVWVPAP